MHLLSIFLRYMHMVGQKRVRQQCADSAEGRRIVGMERRHFDTSGLIFPSKY